MLTILNRIFLPEISMMIMKFIVQDKINSYVIPKMYILYYRMLKFINMYKLNENILYCMKINFIEIKDIYMSLNLIKNHYIDIGYYNHDELTNKIIKEFNNTIYTINEQSKDKLVYLLIKNMIF